MSPKKTNWAIFLTKKTNINERRKMNHADFDARLRTAREARNELPLDKQTASLESGKAKAFRISSEIIVATAVGGGIGFLMDAWLNTKPWLLILFFLLGNIAGLWNVFRLTRGYNYRLGFNNNDQTKKISKNGVTKEGKK